MFFLFDPNVSTSFNSCSLVFSDLVYDSRQDDRRTIVLENHDNIWTFVDQTTYQLDPVELSSINHLLAMRPFANGLLSNILSASC